MDRSVSRLTRCYQLAVCHPIDGSALIYDLLAMLAMLEMLANIDQDAMRFTSTNYSTKQNNQSSSKSRP